MTPDKVEQIFSGQFTLVQRGGLHGKHRVYASLFHPDGSWVSSGYNTASNHPLAVRYAKHEKVVGACAELNAIINAIRKERSIAGGVMFVSRAKKSKRGGDFVQGLAKPCAGCMRALRDFKLKRVYWTTDEPGHHDHADVTL